MAQAKLTGPEDHPLATADRIEQIESSPSTWLFDDGDVGVCTHCGTRIPLGDGHYIAVTLAEGNALDHTTHVKRLCSEECYQEWATEGMDWGW